MEIIGRILAALVLGVCLFFMTNPDSKEPERFVASVIAAAIFIFVV